MPNGAPAARLDSTSALNDVRWPIADLPEGSVSDVAWTAVDGSRHPVLTDLPEVSVSAAAPIAVQVSTSAAGGLQVARTARLVQVDELGLVDSADPVLQIAGKLAGEWTDPLQVELRGPRDILTASAEAVDGGFRASIPILRTDAWGNSRLAPTPGGYRLWLRDAAGHEALGLLSRSVVAGLYTWEFTDEFNARLENHPEGGLWMVVNDSRPLAEIGAYARKQFRARYQGSGTTPEDAVYFESFRGKFCSCNPKAIFDELSRRESGLSSYWGVKDHSVPVPPGATAVTINSGEWWRVRSQARYLVVNDWLENTYADGPHQRVMQTWHGTALKLLALDRVASRQNVTFAESVRAESARWDLLLAENAYSVDLMRRAYDYSGVVLESGYPRNDILTADAGLQVRERLRKLLDIAPEQQAVLYAPTWREDRTSMVNDLDLGALAEELGDGFVILARGHMNTLRRNAELDLARVIDVTSYPEASDLFCAADICITDYSSVMFDFTVTGKPLLFFTPDYRRYMNDLRGVYFELSELAPGPLLTSLEDTVDAVANSAHVRQQWSERYDGWVKKFNAWDDGHAAARAADALLAP